MGGCQGSCKATFRGALCTLSAAGALPATSAALPHFSHRWTLAGQCHLTAFFVVFPTHPRTDPQTTPHTSSSAPPPFSPPAPPTFCRNRYYRYTGMMLPVEYNTMASDSLNGNLTVGGRPPVVVHFTQNKPFGGPVLGKPGHQFLCSGQELQR